jgi:hypothetical protein
LKRVLECHKLTSKTELLQRFKGQNLPPLFFAISRPPSES